MHKSFLLSFVMVAIMPINAVTIRSASSSDVVELAKTHYVSWQKAYLGIHSKRFYEAQDEKTFEIYWRNYFENPVHNSFVLIAIEHEKIIGFVAGRPVKDTASFYDNHDCELSKLYIVPEAQRLGLGKQLLRECQKKLREFGYKKMIVRALKENRPSCLFYEGQGGIGIGQRLCLVDDAVNEIYYSFSLL